MRTPRPSTSGCKRSWSWVRGGRAALRCARRVRLRGPRLGPQPPWPASAVGSPPERASPMPSRCWRAWRTPGETNERVFQADPYRDLSTFYGHWPARGARQRRRLPWSTGPDTNYWARLDMGATTFWEGFSVDWMENSTRIDELPQLGSATSTRISAPGATRGCATVSAMAGQRARLRGSSIMSSVSGRRHPASRR